MVIVLLARRLAFYGGNPAGLLDVN
jgi:hypothetical protein